MTKKQARTLRTGRPGETVWVRGTVRNVAEVNGKVYVEVQFPTYSLDFDPKVIRKERKKKLPLHMRSLPLVTQ